MNDKDFNRLIEGVKQFVQIRRDEIRAGNSGKPPTTTSSDNCSPPSSARLPSKATPTTSSSKPF